jgi:predicted HAD superfamily phosphohydrolase YqeG
LKTKKLPPDNVLLYIFKVAKEYLKQENNNWITFDFDNSLIKTKDKTFNYDFYTDDITKINEI